MDPGEGANPLSLSGVPSRRVAVGPAESLAAGHRRGTTPDVPPAARPPAGAAEILLPVGHWDGFAIPPKGGFLACLPRVFYRWAKAAMEVKRRRRKKVRRMRKDGIDANEKIERENWDSMEQWEIDNWAWEEWIGRDSM